MDTTSTRPQEAPPGLDSSEPPTDRVRIVSTPGVRGGKPRIDGHRVTVADVSVWHERQGLSPDEIVDRHPGVTLSDVHAALAYYFEHRGWIDAEILAGERQVEQLRAGQPSLFDRLPDRGA